MVGNSAKIEYGPCQVTFNAVDLGYFKGGVVLKYDATFLQIEVDQLSMIVDEKLQKEICVATVPMVELELSRLTSVAPTGTYVLDGTKKKITFGGKQVSSSDFHQLIVTPLTDGALTLDSDSNEKATVHLCMAHIQLSKKYDREGIKVVPVEFHAIADTTKDAANMLFTLGDTSASV